MLREWLQQGHAWHALEQWRPVAETGEGGLGGGSQRSWGWISRVLGAPGGTLTFTLRWDPLEGIEQRKGMI